MKNRKILITAIASLVVIAATAVVMVTRKGRERDAQPSGKAPQVPINNPGDQSNFPAAPTGESELG